MGELKTKLKGLGGLSKVAVVKFQIFGPYASRNATMGSGTPVGSSRSRARILCTFDCKSKRSHSYCRSIYTYIHICT